MPKFKIDPKASVIVLYAKIKGDLIARPRMAFDTGATYVMIPWEMAEALGLEPEVSKERMDIITASGVEKAPLVTLESITVLGLEAKNVKAVVHDLPPKSCVDGLLGLSFLRRVKFCVDLKVGILELEEDKSK